MMRTIATLLLAGLLLGAATVSLAAPAPATQPEPAAQQALLQYAAADFTQHGPSVQQVRHVHLRYNLLASGERSYVLCGEFISRGDAAQWTNFATIKTDPYEQWLGTMAKSQCEQAAAVPAVQTDLSAQLEALLRAVK